MQRVFIFWFLFFVSVSLEAAPEFLANYPKQAFHLLRSDSQIIGRTSNTWSESPGGLNFTEVSEMKVLLFGKEQSLQTKIEARTDHQLKLIEFVYEMISRDSFLSVRGQRVGDQLRISKTQAGNTQTKDILIQEPLLLSPSIRPFILQQGMPTQKGQKKRLTAFLLEPSAHVLLPMTVDMEHLSGDQIKLDVGYLSHVLQSEVKANAELIVERSEIAGLKVEAQPATQEAYKKVQLRATSLDLVEQAKVDFPELKNARSLSSLTVDISGVSLHGFQLNRHRQKLKGTQLTIQPENFPPQSDSLQSLVGKKEFDQYLKADISIPVFDPSIQRKAREIVGQESDLFKRALRVHDFVHGHLEKDPFVSLPDALEALKTKRGDCNEHAVLYTALARAAGIPTKMVVGLVYSENFYGGGKPGFYYHAWVEVYTGKQWVSLDPTWNQKPSDATHIVFVEGGADQQIQIASLMGKIRLQLVNKT